MHKCNVKVTENIWRGSSLEEWQIQLDWNERGVFESLKESGWKEESILASLGGFPSFLWGKQKDEQ